MKNILFILLFMYSLAFAKVQKIEDEFYGTTYYQSDVVSINYIKMYFDYGAQFIFNTANGDINTILMHGAFGMITEVFTVNDVLLKCSNGYILKFIPTKISDKVSTLNNSFTKTGDKAQAVKYTIILSKEDIDALKTGIDMIRINSSDGYKNINITKNESKKFIQTLDEFLKFIKK